MIEEIRKRIKERMTYCSDAYENGQNVAYSDVLSIIDEVVKEHRDHADVEKAAELYAREMFPGPATRGFIAGAGWQRERLMKESVEVAVYYDFENRLAVTAQLPKDSPHKFCDKVKLIILKEDEK